MTELDREALLPCPFCGGRMVAQGASRDYISVWCGGCGARGPEVKFPEYCDPLPPIDECRAAWNRRAPALSPKADDGWIEWKGGKCPVEPGSRVEVRFRNESFMCGTVDRARQWDWHHSPEPDWGGNIVAYRPVQP